MAKKPEPMVTIAPVKGFFIQGVPTIEQTVPKSRADFLVAHGAFRVKRTSKANTATKPAPATPAKPEE